MTDRIRAFLRVLGTDRVAMAGAVLTTTAFLLSFFFILTALLGGADNPYTGIVGFFLLPAMFLLGLFLVAAGLWRLRRRSGYRGWNVFSEDFLSTRLKERESGRVARLISLLTLINVVFLLFAGTQGLHLMDKASFCGTTCHYIMIPEYTAWISSPHARVKCVDCHVGEGTEAKIRSKINGAWQLVSMTFDLYERPIPTPVRQLRPARETCEQCHWPERFTGDMLVTRVRYESDEASTPTYTSLNLKVGTGETGRARGIHWHVAAENTVRYKSLRDEREIITWVEWTRPDGSVSEYSLEGFQVEAALEGLSEEEIEFSREIRLFDCVDCHNRATHIYQDPARAVDERMAAGDLDRSLPYLKREAVAALTRHWPDRASGAAGIDRHLRGFYNRALPVIDESRRAALDRTVNAVQEIYLRNIHPKMRVGWNPYPDHLGHRRKPGCFRCHTSAMKSTDGRSLSHDCTLCHSILANRSSRPLAYLGKVSGPERLAAEALRDEFLQTAEPVRHAIPDLRDLIPGAPEDGSEGP